MTSTTTPTTPTPTTASLVARHYAALGGGRLLGHRCTDCGAWTVPVTTACASCGSLRYEEAELAGTGTLLFAAHNTAPAPHPRFAALAPYVYGHVMLDEGVPLQGIVQGVGPTPEATRALFERGPVPVVLDVLRTDDLPVVAFRLA